MSNPAMVGPSKRERRSTPLLRTMLGDVLRRTRRQQGRTLADVARVARVSMAYLSELERGRKEASSEVLAAVCDALRIELSQVLVEVGRDLVDHRARASAVRTSTVQTSTVRTSTVQTSTVQTSTVQTSVVSLDAARRRRASSRVRGSGDVRCMLAA